MEIAEYLDIIERPESRTRAYKQMVQFYYEFATEHYRRLWGDSFHLTWFADGQSLHEAQQAQELWLAGQGGFGPGMRVLDIGCGVGGPAFAIAAHTGARVTGVNISPQQTATARLRAAAVEGARAEFMTGDAMELPFGDEAFDAAYSIEAICHVPDKAKAYEQAARVLVPGGAFVGCDWFVRDGICAEDRDRTIEPICQMVALPGLISMAELAEALDAAGFAVQSLSQYPDHGDISPNWRLFEQVGAGLGGSVEEAVLRDSLGLLRRGAECGDFVLGCWVARKRPGSRSGRFFEVGRGGGERSRGGGRLSRRRAIYSRHQAPADFEEPS